MKYSMMTVGPVQENTYILVNEKKEALIIDPGAEGKRINKKIESLEIKPLAILLTHAHFDHIGAVDDVKARWGIPVYIHEREAEWLSDVKKNGSAFFGQHVTAQQADHLIKEEGKLTLGSFEMDVLETPGHSPGSVSYYFANAKAVFSGDALFAGSIGRTDLQGGSQRVLLESIHSRLLVLPEETVVAPGHGPTTTIGNEMDSNPFLSGF
ncbi:MBL fold metallo-hydrolase [Fictibacillus iocasae]|uniref:MBL fold metallo-hydrolase n=1 Tax=Fictibacillus iocasae TaxID=2715437 RepID=A0ABW2NMH7_9BACL